MEIRKIDEYTFEYWKKVKTVKLPELQEEKAALETELLNMREPTDEELLEEARAVHPFGMRRDALLDKMEKVSNILKEVEAIKIKPEAK